MLQRLLCLTYWRLGDRVVILKCNRWYMLGIKFMRTSCEIALKWMPLKTFDDKLRLVMLGPVRQRSITSANFGPELYRHMAPIGSRLSLFHWIGGMLWQRRRGGSFCNLSSLEIKELLKQNEKSFTTESWLKNPTVYFPTIIILCHYIVELAMTSQIHRSKLFIGLQLPNSER